MKRNFSKNSHRDKVDKVEKKASIPGGLQKEKSSKRRPSIFDEFEEEELEVLDPKLIRYLKTKK